ncbi:hypothetical protein V4T70_004285 [Vibrio vulnificus]|nr:hypothetical protein [Vibrio vulnificus]EGQ8190081.1 hypothetical protein [Vibrio cholerae]EIA1289640.1 hypothetical protein [Vibrio vulnificus]ELI0377441.1 hypothetical protein [Vibrio cholerae]ELP5932591.1 hypothetical protein [Vibrio vulnificus]
MFSLQTALDERLASLKKKKVSSKQSVAANDTTSEYIQKSLKQAGILDKKGKMIKRIAS